MAQALTEPINSEGWGASSANCYHPLEATTLELWRIPLKQPVDLKILSADEIRRFKRYRFDEHRHKFSVARGSLRRILACYSSKTPAGLVFDYGRYGKPSLRDDASLQFNLSHSGDYALCGVARHSLGVDIEQLRPMDRLDGLIQRCLTAGEQTAFDQVGHDQHSNIFLSYWTCKEAYLKATGQGISESLTGIEVSFTPQPHFRTPNAPWQLQTFVPYDGYTAAVVMSPTITQVRLWTYEG